MIEEDFPEELIENDEAFSCVYPVAHCAGWTTKEIKDAIEKYKENKIGGTDAGMSLRTILTTLINLPTKKSLLIFKKYAIVNDEIDPLKNKFEDILKVFAENDVSSRDIVYLFGFPYGVDFVDILHRFEEQHIWT